MTIQAIYENGVFRPLQPVDLPDRTNVEIAEVKVVGESEKKTDGPLARLLEIAYRYPRNPDAPTDGAAQHDHYLYGTPKRP